MKFASSCQNMAFFFIFGTSKFIQTRETQAKRKNKDKTLQGKRKKNEVKV